MRTSRAYLVVFRMVLKEKRRYYSACVLAERIWLFFEWYAAVRLGGGVCIRRKFGIQYRVQYVAVRTIRTFRTFGRRPAPDLGAAQRPILAPPSLDLGGVQRIRWSPTSVYAGRRPAYIYS